MNISRINVGIVDSVIVRSFVDSGQSVAGTCSTPPSPVHFGLNLLLESGCVWYVSAAERRDDPTHSLLLLKVFTTFDTITCKKWVVVDGGGKPRIVAATTADGAVVLPIKDMASPKK